MEKLVEGQQNPKDAKENLFRRSRYETSLQFDYEVNSVELAEKNGEIIAYDKKSKTLIDFNNFHDSISNINPDGPAKPKTNALFKANCIKRLVSKKKHRIQNEYFDLDMAYITPRILAMGFPSTGCESLYRNSLKDAKFFLNRYHSEYKIYNLCLENGRIYPKDTFDGKKVGLFPFMDHEPCPIKLMLEFCTDLCLYLTRNDNGIGVVHCKAGKGRTGVMIICYLIFSGLCENSFEAIDYFAELRTINKKGVTIPSQIRYIQYFETFLSTNFTKPYYRMIPQIMHYHITSRVANTLRNYLFDNGYFFTENKFCLKHLRIGPFNKSRNFKVKISSLIRKEIVFPNKTIRLENDAKDGRLYLDIDFNSEDLFNCDIKIECSAFKFQFYSWINLWYSTLENLSHYIITNELIQLSSLLLKDKKNLSPKKDSVFKSLSIEENHSRSDENLSKKNNNLLMGRKTQNFAADLMKKVQEFELNNNSDDDEIIEESDEVEIIEENNNQSPKEEEINTSSNEFIINTSSRGKSQMIELEQVKQISDMVQEPKKRISIKRCSIGRLIDLLKDDKDLIQFVHGINRFAEKLKIPIFDMTNQKIILEKSNLDKFTDSFNVVGNEFLVEYTYSLEQGK